MEYDDLARMRHSCAHVMADAVTQLFPGTRLSIGPAIENGFYYDFDLPRPISLEDLPAIEAKMREIAAQKLPFSRSEISPDAGAPPVQAMSRTSWSSSMGFWPGAKARMERRLRPRRPS